MEEKPVYIHYGDNEYRTPNPIKNKNYCWVKPYGGLWASRKDDPCGWKSWCEGEEFKLDSFNKSFEFTLNDNARILVLNDTSQLDILPKVNPWYIRYDRKNPFSWCFLDFEKLQEDYDAIELTNIGKFYFLLYGWDCNCILIMNPDIVNVIEKEPA